MNFLHLYATIDKNAFNTRVSRTEETKQNDIIARTKKDPQGYSLLGESGWGPVKRAAFFTLVAYKKVGKLL